VAAVAGLRLRAVAAIAIALLVLAACARPRVAFRPPERTVESVVAALGPAARVRWAPFLRDAGLAYPPRQLALLAFKRERRLEVWGRDDDGPWRRIDMLPILAASGLPGPKLRQGDRQVPEGIYAVPALNPNSRFHLSIMLDYPNAYDLAVADAEGRTDLGGEIFIHGAAVSIGCLAMGDRAIEHLFVLVADVGIENVMAIVAPRDPRDGIGLAPVPGLPFTADLYRQIETALLEFRAP